MPRSVYYIVTATVAFVCTAPLRMSAAPIETLILNGPPSNRIDVVTMGEGYTADEIDSTYQDHMGRLTDRIFFDREDPFPRYQNFFNVHRVNLVSPESGVDVPTEGIFRDTALDATYGDFNVLDVNHAKVQAEFVDALAGAGWSPDIPIVIVNTDRGGAFAGNYVVYTGAHPFGPSDAIHEIGHLFSNLLDEYVLFPDETYTGPELPWANVTISPTGEKWARWLGFDDPDHPEIGPIGAFEGAGFVGHGLFRPAQESKMRGGIYPFDAVSREKVILDVYARVDPLDDWLANDQPLADPTSVWVDTIDPNVIRVDWYLDGQLLPGVDGETLTMPLLPPGIHLVFARAFDDTPWVRLNSADLEQWLTWTVEISGALGDYSRNGVVDAADYTLWRDSLGATGVGLAADGNGDNMVTVLDYEIWKSHFGESAGSGGPSGASPSAAALPEPVSFHLLVAAGIVMVVLRRRKSAGVFALLLSVPSDYNGGYAPHQRVLRNRHRNVLERPQPAPFPCEVRRAPGRIRHPNARHTAGQAPSQGGRISGLMGRLAPGRTARTMGAGEEPSAAGKNRTTSVANENGPTGNESDLSGPSAGGPCDRITVQRRVRGAN